jgi:hypothetical protein
LLVNCGNACEEISASVVEIVSHYPSNGVPFLLELELRLPILLEGDVEVIVAVHLIDPVLFEMQFAA